MKGMNLNFGYMFPKVKVSLIGAVLAGIAFFVASGIYKGQNREIASLNSAIDTETKKSEILEKIKKTEKTVSAYRDKLAKEDYTFLINSIAAIAQESGVQISTIRSPDVSKGQVYTRASFNLPFSVDNYHILGQFIGRLEGSKDVYFFVDRLGITSAGQAEKLNVNLTVSTIIFKG